MTWGRGVLAASAGVFLALIAATAMGQSASSVLAPTGSVEPIPGEAPARIPAKPAAPEKYDEAKSLDAARNLVRLYKERLKTELASAIRTDGAANAVSLCQTTAPDISTALTDEAGFEVARTSLKLRNPENAPDPWELEVLKNFDKQAEAGADPDKLETFAVIVTPEGDKLLRYMRGIPTGEMCLNCHGNNLKPDVKAELARYYPDDKAIGYRLAELRGAFSLVKLIGE